MEKDKYDPHFIESKWQKFWQDHSTFAAEMDATKPKYYVLDMFPYPSGAGLHVGHAVGYTASDILARYHRMKGYNVLHPMGWDSFGLPAEQYAIRTGVHPAITTKNNIDNYRRQLKAMGFSYDWNREISTSNPDYYKWTQWIFTKLHDKELAYEAQMLVNYCPSLGTVVANEEIENGKTKEGGYDVERRPLRQWVLKITQYAEQLLQDLDLVDWPESVKMLQRNWIGRSSGAQITFSFENRTEEITVFTTRADTIFGVSYLVLAPEHPLVEKITSPQQKAQVEEYQKETAKKSDFLRTELTDEKTGVSTGAYAINPVSGKKVPVWISDYVLPNYASGAIMGVPAHDMRDYAFAKKYWLNILPVIMPRQEDISLHEQNIPLHEFHASIAAGALCWTGNGLICNSSASNSFSIDGLQQESAIEKVTKWLQENNKGQPQVSYKLRDWLFSRQRYWGEPFPILHFADGSHRTLALDELPLCPPEIADYKPSNSGQSLLAKAKEWTHIIDPKTGRNAIRETNTMPQWAGSCWYYLRFCDPNNESAAWSSDKENYWMPVDLYLGGVEHAVLHLLYARFWHKVLHDCGYVSTKEPFLKYRYPGIVTARSYRRKEGGYVHPDEVEEKAGRYFCKKNGQELLSQIEKMSKSKLNGVSPDEIIEEFGADALRLYEMFLGPLDKEKIWNTDAVTGCRRFLHRFYDLVQSDKITTTHEVEGLKLAHRLSDGVEKDVQNMQFNTAVAKMMEFVNAFTALPFYSHAALKIATLTLAPFAPHIAEELWQQLGETKSLSFHPYPVADAQFLVDSTMTYIIQVNGKLRATLPLPKDISQEELVSLARQHAAVQNALQSSSHKIIFVQNKLLNFVTI